MSSYQGYLFDTYAEPDVGLFGRVTGQVPVPEPAALALLLPAASLVLRRRR